MCGDFNRIIIQLSQHPVVNKSFSDLTCTECEQAYVLINELISLSVEEDYTLLDYIQMARLKYYLGELSCKIYSVKEDAALHYGSALHLLEKGGLDLSLKKWIELVRLRRVVKIVVAFHCCISWRMFASFLFAYTWLNNPVYAKIIMSYNPVLVYFIWHFSFLLWFSS